MGCMFVVAMGWMGLLPVINNRYIEKVAREDEISQWEKDYREALESLL